MENKEIARIIWETADLMEIAGEDSFRIRSYRNGATAIEGHPERIEDILKDPARKVTDIQGIGKGLAVVLQEIVDHRSCERRDALLKKFPSGALEFLKIQGLGRRASRYCSSTTRWAPSTSWSSCARTRSCACCRAWGPSWKRRC